MLVFVVLGGIGNIRGSVIAAAVLYVLPELLRGLNDYRMLIYAVILIVMMIFNQSAQVVAWRHQVWEKLSTIGLFQKLAQAKKQNKGEA